MRLVHALVGLPILAITLATDASSDSAGAPASPFPNRLWACGHCHTCTEPGVGTGHDFHDTDPQPLDGTDHSCFGDIECNLVHLNCGTGSDEEESTLIASALAAAAGGDPRAAASLVPTLGTRMQLNEERGLLQIAALCSPDYVVAQVPISADVVAILNAAGGTGSRTW